MNAATGPELRDIHLPPPPGWWPPAPGWWILAALVGFAVFAALYKLRQMHERRNRNRAVLDEFEQCVAANRTNPVALAAALSHFLRRMTLRESRDAAAFSGERWLEYLDARGGGEEFRRGVGRTLVDAPFRPQSDYDTAALIALVRRWTQGRLAAGAAGA